MEKAIIFIYSKTRSLMKEEPHSHRDYHTQAARILTLTSACKEVRRTLGIQQLICPASEAAADTVCKS